MHLSRWGPHPFRPGPRCLLLHGWQDTGDTFQFMVDAFEQDWPLRGARLARLWAQRVGAGRLLVSRIIWPISMRCWSSSAPGVPARIVGHSMGGNVASLYAGLRPERVRCVVNLEGFGLPRTSPDQAPAKLRKWLDQVKAVPPLKDYDSFEQLARHHPFPLSALQRRRNRISSPRPGAGSKPTGVSICWGMRAIGGSIRCCTSAKMRKRAGAAIKAPMLMLLGEQSELPRAPRRPMAPRQRSAR